MEMKKEKRKLVEECKPDVTSPFEWVLFAYINTTIIECYYFYIEIFCQFKNTSYVCIEE